ncbi:hypothetical protein NEIPOLOT_00454 [Neisseria polysaccharea ATCC 43768]|nr:hypothetical protein NEIPOLOT_00454 [Neisseria polysaccharea ATCC 43768]
MWEHIILIQQQNTAVNEIPPKRELGRNSEKAIREYSFSCHLHS